MSALLTIFDNMSDSDGVQCRDRKEMNLGRPAAKACVHLPGEAVGSQPNKGILFPMCSFAAIPTAFF
jgi:hypothetical protein